MGEPFSLKKSSHFQLNKWKQLHAQLIVGFTTRLGGVSVKPYDSMNMGLHVSDKKSSVIENRKLLANSIRIPLNNWVSGEQTHETNIVEVGHEDRGKGATDITTSLQAIDGIITKETGMLNTAFFADCVPLYFFDPESEYIGIAHAGWKGTVNNIAQNMVNKLTSQGVKRENLLVAIGPSISQKHYEVDDFIINQLDAENQTSTVVKQGGNRYLLDLKQLNVNNLLKAGVLRHHIAVTSYCTYANEDLFYSYRRDGKNTGRMLGFIGYREKN